MNSLADHPLFAGARRSPRVVVAWLALVVVALILNVACASATVSAGLAALGLALVGLRAGRRRLARALAWSAVAALLTAASARWSGAELTAAVTLRVAAGMSWILCLGAELDWPSLRGLMRRLGLPDEALGTLDLAVLHGLLTEGAWIRRRDAARLRLGRAWLPVSAWGAVVAEGAMEALDRADAAEASASLRGASSRAAVPSDEPALSLEGVSLVEGGARRLDGVDLRLDAGEWLLVCGPSGAGKSSLLALISGLAAHTGGAMRRLGAPIELGAPLRARLDGRVGLLAQNPEHHVLGSTPAADVAWGLTQRGVPAAQADAQARRALVDLGVEHLADRPVHTLSFGEQRRVALAGVLVVEPRLLLLDEPTSGLDPLAAEALVEAVEAAASRSGAACVWVTHDLQHIPRCARRTLLMRSGRGVFDGARALGLSPERLSDAGLAHAQRSPSPPRSEP
jgi:energy-coupling factor transporter ATP-binding protein EcfA2